MSKINDGGPAFPRPMSAMNSVGLLGQDGMTLRDYFAAAAMQGLIHDILIDQHWEDVIKGLGVPVEAFPAYLSHLAYVTADAMIARRNKESENGR